MKQMDTTHLVALINGLANEKARLAAATDANEIALRTVWVEQKKREINCEEKFLGLPLTDWDVPEMTDDELFAELGL